jgi:hypothetical protein
MEVTRYGRRFKAEVGRRKEEGGRTFFVPKFFGKSLLIFV